MIPMRSTRSFMAGAMSLSLLAALLAMPVATFAATPSWSIEGSALLPQTVKVGSAAGYTTTIRNGGPSNISQLWVTVFFQQPYAAPAESDDIVNPNPGTGGNTTPAYAAVLKNGVPVAGACPSPLSGPLVCDVGALGDDETATLIVAFPTSATGLAGVHGWWQGNGTGSTFCVEGGDNSQGDCLPFHLGPTTVSNSGNRGGGFALNGNPVGNDAISALNLTSTSMDPLGDVANLIATVADDDAATDPGCPEAFAPCAALPTSELHLGDGTAAFGLSKIVIEFHKNALKGVNFGRLNVIHIHDGVPTTAHEVPKKKTCDGTAECAMFQNLSGGHGRVTIYLAQNGWVKYH